MMNETNLPETEKISLHKSVMQGRHYNLSTLFAVVTICSLLAIKGLGFYDGQPVFYAGLALAMASCVCKILTARQSLQDWILILAVCGIAGICWLSSRDKSMLIAAMMLLCVKDVPEKLLMKAGAAVWTVCFTFMAIRYEAGFSAESVLVHPKQGFGYVICHTLGYPHPNVLHVSYALLVIFYLYLIDLYLVEENRKYAVSICEEKGHAAKAPGEKDSGRAACSGSNRDRGEKDVPYWKKLTGASALLMAGNVLMFFNSYSFTGFGMVTVLILLNLILQLRTLHGSLLHRWEEILLQLILPCGVLFMTVGPLLLHEEGSAGRPLYDLFNKLLNTRYELSWWFLTHEPITPFGSVITVPNYRYSMDCSYVNLLVQQGVVPFILFLVGYMMLIRDQLRNRRVTELALTIGMLIGGITEPFLFNTSCKNISLIFLGGFLYRKAEKLPVPFRQRQENASWERFIRKIAGSFFGNFLPICAAMLLAFCVGSGVYRASDIGPKEIYVPVFWTMDEPEDGRVFRLDEVCGLLTDQDTDYDEAEDLDSAENRDTEGMPDVNALRRGKGIEVYGPWEKEFVPATDSTLKWERVRRMLNTGAWAGAIAGVLISVFSAIKALGNR